MIGRSAWLAVLVPALLLSACGGGGGSGQFEPEKLGRCADFDERRRPFFGDTHVHTDLSLDANLQGTRTNSVDAYRFARGETIGVQPYDGAGMPLRTLTLDRPLDFVALSDHASFLGTVSVCQDPSSPAFESRQCVDYRESPASAFIELNGLLGLAGQENAAYPALCGVNATVCKDASVDVWSEVQDAAEGAYDRSSACEFTSLVGYEWTPNPDAANLHRNIIFRNGIVPDRPISFFDAPFVEDLWAGLRAECIDSETGCDALTIPHNSNVANGRFFANRQKDGTPFDAAYVEERAEMEPIVEIFQHKGASECLPGQGAPDEFCGFELMPFSNLAATNLCLVNEPVPSDFVRSAYGAGMELEGALGTNPFKHGIIASTDTHIGASGAVSEAGFLGHGGAGQANRDRPTDPTLPPVPALPDIMYLNPGGLAGVWAEENSREALFLAMRRKETFGTSGPRIVVRLFGGWDFPADLCDSVDAVVTADATGVPMGGDLADRPSGAQAPVFFLSALQDPGTEAEPGVPLQRIQIVKGWLDPVEGYQVQVFDLNDDHDNGATVDLDTCEPQGSGHSTLCSRWVDPSFDPGQRAYYYARVLENPSCRWTTRICRAADVDCDARSTPLDQACCDPVLGLNDSFCADVDCNEVQAPGGCAFPLGAQPTTPRCCLPRIEPTVQERAWSSPIWYTPPS